MPLVKLEDMLETPQGQSTLNEPCRLQYKSLIKPRSCLRRSNISLVSAGFIASDGCMVVFCANRTLRGQRRYPLTSVFKTGPSLTTFGTICFSQVSIFKGLGTVHFSTSIDEVNKYFRKFLDLHMLNKSFY